MESGILVYARQRMPVWLVLRKTDSCLWVCHICDMCHFSNVPSCCWEKGVLSVTPQGEYSWSLCLVSSELHPVCLFPLPIFLCICSLFYVLSLSTTLCWVLWILLMDHWAWRWLWGPPDGCMNLHKLIIHFVKEKLWRYTANYKYTWFSANIKAVDH